MCKNLNFTLDARYFRESFQITNAVIDELYARALTPDDRRALVRLGFVRNDFENVAGGLSFAERKVNISLLEKTLNFSEDNIEREALALIKKKKKAFLEKVSELLDAGKIEDAVQMEISFGGELSKIYAGEMRTAFEAGKKSVADEMKVSVPSNPEDVTGIMRAQALALEKNIETQINSTTASEVGYQIGKGVAVNLTMEAVEKALSLKIQKMVAASGTQAVVGAFNGGRLVSYRTNLDKIYGFQYTAVMDKRTTNLCRSLSGRVVDAKSSDFYTFSPPNHVRCRSFWVEILKDEFIKPEISGIPSSFPRNRTGMNNFQDLQKVSEHKPAAAPTDREREIQKEGVQNLISELQKK